MLPEILERVFLHMRFYNREMLRREQIWGLAPRLLLRKSCHPWRIDPRHDPKSILDWQDGPMVKNQMYLLKLGYLRRARMG